MSSTLTCSCGARLRARDELAGKRLKCPKCGRPVVVPPARPSPAAAEAYALSPEPAAPPPGRDCPSCSAPLAPAAVLCVRCGFHLLTGQRLTTERGAEEGELDDAAVQQLLKGRSCPQCGKSLGPRVARCPTCDVEVPGALPEKPRQARPDWSQAPVGSYERRQADRQADLKAEREQATGPFREYRQATVRVLAGLRRELRAAGEEDEVRVRELLRGWPDQLRACLPPADLLDLPPYVLCDENHRTLGALEEHIRQLTARASADQARADWEQDPTVPKDERFTLRLWGLVRLERLYQLARGLGKGPDTDNPICVYLDATHVCLNVRVPAGLCTSDFCQAPSRYPDDVRWLLDLLFRRVLRDDSPGVSLDLPVPEDMYADSIHLDPPSLRDALDEQFRLLHVPCRVSLEIAPITPERIRTSTRHVTRVLWVRVKEWWLDAGGWLHKTKVLPIDEDADPSAPPEKALRFLDALRKWDPASGLTPEQYWARYTINNLPDEFLRGGGAGAPAVP